MKTIKCYFCGESWDEDTPGYEDAKRKMMRGDHCPSCYPDDFQLGAAVVESVNEVIGTGCGRLSMDEEFILAVGKVIRKNLTGWV
jgi:hypothetical protein